MRSHINLVVIKVTKWRVLFMVTDVMTLYSKSSNLVNYCINLVAYLWILFTEQVIPSIVVMHISTNDSLMSIIYLDRYQRLAHFHWRWFLFTIVFIPVEIGITSRGVSKCCYLEFPWMRSLAPPATEVQLKIVYSGMNSPFCYNIRQWI